MKALLAPSVSRSPPPTHEQVISKAQKVAFPKKK